MANEPMYYMTVGFQLGILVAKMVCGPDPADHSDEVLDCLRRIANGELTPIDSHSELLRRFPDEPRIQEGRRQSQEILRNAAKAVLFVWDEDDNSDE
ncbi:MAG: hypothetical protein ACLQNE_33205 [Thermoguttaceae bacterium]